MKKILFIVLALVLMGATVAFAEEDLTDTKTCIVNTSTTSLFTLVDVTKLIPGKCQVTKVTVSPNGTGNTECMVAVYDSSSIDGAGNKQLEGEVESDGTESATLPYERPLKISNGLVIGQGAKTSVTVEWERIIP